MLSNSITGDDKYVSFIFLLLLFESRVEQHFHCQNMFVNDALIWSISIVGILFAFVGLSSTRRKRTSSTTFKSNDTSNAHVSIDLQRKPLSDLHSLTYSSVVLVNTMDDEELIKSDFPSISMLAENIELRLDEDSGESDVESDEKDTHSNQD